jgi:hypothetical protein
VVPEVQKVPEDQGFLEVLKTLDYRGYQVVLAVQAVLKTQPDLVSL